MSGRPRRFAAQKAVKAITDMADRDDDRVSTRRTMSSRSRNTDTKARGTVTASVSRTSGPTSSPTRGDSGQHMHLTVKAPASKLRQAISGSSANNDKSSVTVKGRALAREESDEIIASGRRNTRGVGKKSYVVESDSEEEEDEEQEDEVAEADEITVGSAKADDDDEDEDEEDEEEEEDEDENDDLGDDDADGEVEEVDEMDVDADGDIDMDLDAAPPPPPTIRVSKQSKGTTKVKIATPPKKSAMKKAGSTPQKNKATVTLNDDDDDDEELSELDSDMDMDDTVNVGGEEDAEGEDEDLDAEGEDIEVADDDGLGDSDDDESRAETPDVSRMTARQRAKHGDAQTEYMKLSDGRILSVTTDPVGRSKATNYVYRGPSQEALHSRRTVHETSRNGSPQTQPEREAE